METIKNIYKFHFLSTIIFSLVFILGTFLSLPNISMAESGNNFHVSTSRAIQSGNKLILKGEVFSPEKNTMIWFRWGETSSLQYATTPTKVSWSRNIKFSDTISGTDENTTYYYQIVAENTEGYRVFGAILSTNPSWNGTDGLSSISNSTSNTTYNTTYTSNTYATGKTAPIVVTQIAENIEKTSVKLSGLALPGGRIPTNAWFEWGTTITLGIDTLHENIGSSTSIDFSKILTGLSPNKTYYFRAVIQNNNGISFGNTLSFKTKNTSVSPVQTTAISVTPKTHVIKNTSKENAPVKKSDGTTNNQSATASVVNNSFFPNTLIEWLLLILLIVLIVAAGDHIREKKEERKKKRKL